MSTIAINAAPAMCQYIVQQTELFLRNPVLIADVGARDGYNIEWKAFANCMRAFCFELDTEECARLNKIGKPHEPISERVLERMSELQWHGNIRALAARVKEYVATGIESVLMEERAPAGGFGNSPQGGTSEARRTETTRRSRPTRRSARGRGLEVPRTFERDRARSRHCGARRPGLKQSKLSLRTSFHYAEPRRSL